MEIKLFVNGEKIICDVSPSEMLKETLRKHGYLSVKGGCDTGSCGLCTVWIDKKPSLSCSIPTFRANNKEITTIEGVQEQANEFADFLVNEGAEQCGFCSPGFIMTVLAMEMELNDFTDENITSYLTGNLCRCTGYEGQLRAIKKYLRRNQNEIR